MDRNQQDKPKDIEEFYVVRKSDGARICNFYKGKDAPKIPYDNLDKYIDGWLDSETSGRVSFGKYRG
jgi:hypothetical protein